METIALADADIHWLFLKLDNPSRVLAALSAEDEHMFNRDEAAALASLRALAGFAADVVLPGHGPAYHGSPASAVQQAVAAHR